MALGAFIARYKDGEWRGLSTPHIQALCRRQWDLGVRTPTLVASTLRALRLNDGNHHDNDRVKALEAAIVDLPAAAREDAFWAEHEFLAALSPPSDPWQRLYTIVEEGGLPLRGGRIRAPRGSSSQCTT